MQRELLAEYEIEEPGGEGFVHEENAELLSDGESPGEAARHFAAAFRLLSGLGSLEPDRLERLRRLAAG